MALKIRLRRMGRKKSPTYRIVVAETTMPRDGRFVAIFGHYNPRTEPITLVVDREKALHWLDQGAIPTGTAKSLLKRAGVFGPAPTVTEAAVEGVRETAKKVAGKARGAAAGASAAVADAVEEIREAVTGEPAAEKEAEPTAAAEPATTAEAAEAPTAEAEPTGDVEPAAAEEPVAAEEEKKASPAAE